MIVDTCPHGRPVTETCPECLEARLDREALAVDHCMRSRARLGRAEPVLHAHEPEGPAPTGQAIDRLAHACVTARRALNSGRLVVAMGAIDQAAGLVEELRAEVLALEEQLRRAGVTAAGAGPHGEATTPPRDGGLGGVRR